MFPVVYVLGLRSPSVEREFLERFVLAFKNKGRKGGSFLRNYLLGTPGNVIIDGTTRWRTRSWPLVPCLGGRIESKECPECPCKEPQEKFGCDLVENLLHQDGGGLRDGFCPNVLLPERWHLLHVGCWT